MMGFLGSADAETYGTRCLQHPRGRVHLLIAAGWGRSQQGSRIKTQLGLFEKRKSFSLPVDKITS